MKTYNIIRFSLIAIMLLTTLTFIIKYGVPS